jgi:Ca2+/Na+ antiporter
MVYIYLKESNLLSGFFWILLIYLGFAAVIHPWYLTPLVALSVFIRYRFILLWSALVPLSYLTYRTVPYSENLWIIALEYCIVLVYLFYELKISQPHSTNLKNQFIN